MPKNKSKSGGAGGGAARAQGGLREKADGESYALVTKVLGGGNVEAACLDGLSRRIVIRGTIRRRAWIRANDILIIEMRHGMSDETKVVRVQGSAPCAPRARGGGQRDPPATHCPHLSPAVPLPHTHTHTPQADVSQQPLSSEEATALRRAGAFPSSWGTGEEEDDGVVFDYSEEEEALDVDAL